MHRDFLPVGSNSIPLPQELRIEGEIHEVPSPRPELEGRATTESPDPFSSLHLAKHGQAGVSLSIQEQSVALPAYLPFPPCNHVTWLCL